MKKTNKPIKNYQKKKYYTNRNTYKSKTDKSFDSWLDGDFIIDSKTFEVKHK